MTASRPADADAAADVVALPAAQVPPTSPANPRRELLDELAADATTALDAGSAVQRPVLSVLDKFTGRILGTLPTALAADVPVAATRARAAQAAWAATDVRARAQILERFHDLVLDRQDEVLDLIQLENGKARRDAYEEVADTANTARYYANTAPRLLRPRRRCGLLPLLTRADEHRDPYPLVGIISPWNYPLTLGITDALPALAAGCAVLTKPDEQTPFTTLWAARLLREAGLPDDVLQVLPGSGAVLGDPLVDAVDYVMFTGSTRVGRHVATRAATRLIDASMELGGKNPLLVLPDADLDATVAGAARAAFANTGSLCLSVERIYVPAAMYTTFLNRFTEHTRALRLGPGHDWSTDVGSLISARHLARVTDHVDDARSRGARVLTGGRHRPDLGPHFYEPTILTDVTPDMTVATEETFGPVVSVYPYSGEDAAIAAANDSRYGLHASVWTRDPAEGRRVARRLRAGTVAINDGYATAWASVDAPMGGATPDSGIGRRHGAGGLLKYTRTQSIITQRLPFAPPPGATHEQFAHALTAALRLLRHLPLNR